MCRVNVYVNQLGKVDIQGEIYVSRSDRVSLVNTPADNLDSALQYLENLRENHDCEFSITIHRSM